MLMARARAMGVASSVTFDPVSRPALADSANPGRRCCRTALRLARPGHLRGARRCHRRRQAGGGDRLPHAVELLSSGAGMVVPHGDSTALGAALRLFFTEPGRAAAMAREAGRLAPGFGWPAVGSQYASLADRLLVQSKAVPA